MKNDNLAENIESDVVAVAVIASELTHIKETFHDFKRETRDNFEEMKNTTRDNFEEIKSAVNNLGFVALATYEADRVALLQRVKELEDDNKWIKRLVIGAVILAVISKVIYDSSVRTT